MDQLKKRYYILLKGGKCIACGYDRCDAALHFHHINPHEKSFNISSCNNYIKIDKEIKKCVLLCSNCHAEKHNGILDDELILELSGKEFNNE